MALLSIDPRSAIALQRELAAKVRLEDDFTDPPAHIAGVDVAFPDGGRTSRAVAVVLDYPGLEPVEQSLCEIASPLPYIPGLLSFRELPGILGALERLETRPDVVMCDGQGIAHPRRFGIACHLGVATGLPALGIAKSRLCGHHREPGTAKGSTANLVEGDEIIGRVVRTRAGVRPVYVSPGHRICLATAVSLVLACARRFRLPEPVHRADRLTRTD